MLPLQVHKITSPTIREEKGVDFRKFCNWHTGREFSTDERPFILEDSYKGTVSGAYSGEKGKLVDGYVSERHLAVPDGSIAIFAVKYLGNPYSKYPWTSLYFPPLTSDSIAGYRAEIIQITDPRKFYLNQDPSACVFEELEIPITDDTKIEEAWKQLVQYASDTGSIKGAKSFLEVFFNKHS